MAKKKEKQSVEFYFTVYSTSSDANVDLYSRRPKELNQGLHYHYTFCRNKLKRFLSKLKFKIGDRGKVKITIEVIERE